MIGQAQSVILLHFQMWATTIGLDRLSVTDYFQLIPIPLSEYETDTDTDYFISLNITLIPIMPKKTINW